MMLRPLEILCISTYVLVQISAIENYRAMTNEISSSVIYQYTRYMIQLQMVERQCFKELVAFNLNTFIIDKFVTEIETNMLSAAC